MFRDNAHWNSMANKGNKRFLRHCKMVLVHHCGELISHLAIHLQLPLHLLQKVYMCFFNYFILFHWHCPWLVSLFRYWLWIIIGTIGPLSPLLCGTHDRTASFCAHFECSASPSTWWWRTGTRSHFEFVIMPRLGRSLRVGSLWHSHRSIHCV